MKMTALVIKNIGFKGFRIKHLDRAEIFVSKILFSIRGYKTKFGIAIYDAAYLFLWEK
jgi:hypothetical protein